MVHLCVFWKNQGGSKGNALILLHSWEICMSVSGAEPPSMAKAWARRAIAKPGFGP